MDQTQLKEKLQSLPLVPIVLLAAAYLGFDHYQQTTDAGAPLPLKRAELASLREQNTVLETKAKKAGEFERTLEARRVQIRGLARQLDAFRSSLTETLDAPQFIDLVTAEAKKVGLIVTGLEPRERGSAEHTIEQSFEMRFRGVFVQFLVFLDRLAQAKRVVQVSSFGVKPLSSSLSRYVELEGSVQLKAFAYKRSNPDLLVKENAASSQPAAQAAESQPAKAPDAGGGG
jgi:Tfp pilus assembly protein PilO